MKYLGLILALGALAWTPAAMAAERDSEDSLFGASTAAGPTEASSVTPAADAAELIPSDPGKDAFANGNTKEDPLQIGGSFYQQWDASQRNGQTEGETSVSMPLQADVFLDARPNDRLRAYIDARLVYDSTRDAYGNPTAGRTPFLPSAAGSATGTAALPNNPQVLLDQAWLKFDVARTAFVSVGKQHVKWGSGHIWNPSDVLSGQRRDPLQPYDLRLGSNMVKVQVPWEARQANLYAIALTDNPQPASTVQQNGGAVRAEAVLLGAEIGLDAVARSGRNPSYGADLSTGLGPVDVYIEAAVQSGDSQVYEFHKKPGPGDDLSSVYGTYGLEGHALQVSSGVNYSFAYAANRQSTLGAEYFYNETGVTDASLYPVLLYQGRYQPFYVGKNYAAIYLSAEGLDSGKKTSYNLSTLSNLSDGSYVTRLDFNWLLLDYLTFGAFAAGHYGTQGGEFNFSMKTPALTNGATYIPPVDIAATPVDLGLSLRLAF